MAPNLGMNPETIRSYALTLTNQLSSAEAIAQEANTTRIAANNPASYGLDASDKSIAPWSRSSVYTAYREIMDAATAARALAQGLRNQATEQELASGETPGGGGVPVPIPPGPTTTPPGVTAPTGPSSGWTFGGGTYAEAETENDTEVEFSIGGTDSWDDELGEIMADDWDPAEEAASGPDVSIGFSNTTTTEFGTGVEGEATYTDEYGNTYTVGGNVGVGGQSETTTEVEYDGEDLTFGVSNETQVGLQAGTEFDYVGTDGSTFSGESDAFAGLVGGAGVETEISEDGTVSTTASAELGVEASVSTEGEYTNGDLSASYSADASASASVSAEAGYEIGPDGEIVASAEVSAQVGVEVNAEGSVEYGPASLNGEVHAEAGASASASAEATFGPDGAGISAGVQAMAGASASASGSAEIFGAEVGGTVTAYAGAGVQANVDAQFSADQVSVSVDLGVALGIGAGVSFDVSFSPTEMLSDIGGMFGGLF